MGMEISNYLDASACTIQARYGGWTVFVRPEKVRKTEGPWSVQVGLAMGEMYADGFHNRAQLQCQALVRYAGKAPSHDSLPQAMDIAATLAAGINHGTMENEDGRAVGEIVRDVRFFHEVETVVQAGVRVATGAYRVIVQWADETVISPDIEIEGYMVQSPTVPPGQPDVGGDPDQVIHTITIEMPPNEDYWQATVAAILCARTGGVNVSIAPI